MKLHEIISTDEWQKLQQLVFDGTWEALSTYQQQRIASIPAPTLKPQRARATKAVAKKVKKAPQAAPPRPLPKPQHAPQAKAEANPTYRPVKTATHHSYVCGKNKTSCTQALTNKPAPQSINDSNHMDQAARRMLPPDKRGSNPINLLTP